ncbi:hydroxylamine reductase [Desulfuromonas acetoxidans]|uniref:Hydroxylamine reductase n=1 Tax=Desulfuromonas acetoxidans (strain DSM 684 / 11070) TaxID=281689 RepID=Q1K3J6_DESA6|nr:hydroxylamine reductase [Desulfuromonas acetoxidans]EAT16978.1 Hybrid cluster protein [Desulfuromonas acetoxidans DSM 684]
MSMFCFQCQEAAKGTGCTIAGVCGKKEDTAGLQDLLVYNLKGLAVVAEEAKSQNKLDESIGLFICQALFATITNANFDNQRIKELIKTTIAKRDTLKLSTGFNSNEDVVNWSGVESEYTAKAAQVGVLSQPNEDVRSLRELLIYGLKGMAAYTDHAAMLGFQNNDIYEFMISALAGTTRELSVEEMIGQVLKCGEVAVTAMALLDEANTSTYGNPEITKVNIGVRNNPGILISGHDLKDMEELLKQTEGTGVDVYTHSEMLPANYYPEFKKYDHFVGNYGNAWWQQDKEFTSFNGPILMTTNCITPVKDAYRDRIYTTGMAGWPGVTHIAERPDGGNKDFSEIIEKAKSCPAPVEIETGEIVGGFAHAQVMALADKVVDAVKSGAIKRFVVMAGCDGRHTSRSYFTEVAQELPQDAVILTAGCAKYRYNKLDLGDIGGIPRVLDAGQCNDSYSLAYIALKLKEVFELDDINDLPISYDIAWYEQKAVVVLLALLHLGVKHIRLGPTLPAFLSPNVAKVLVENFDIKPIGEVKTDVAAIMAGK